MDVHQQKITLMCQKVITSGSQNDLDNTLYNVCSHGITRLVNPLIEAKADVDAIVMMSYDDEPIPILFSISLSRYDCTGVIRTLIEHKIDVNEKYDGCSILTTLIQNEEFEIAGVLIKESQNLKLISEYILNQIISSKSIIIKRI